jgi:hypothetical protein
MHREVGGRGAVAAKGNFALFLYMLGESKESVLMPSLQRFAREGVQ